MELVGLEKMVPGFLRTSGGTVANSSGRPLALNCLLISKSQDGKEYIKVWGGEKSREI